ncbi:TetR/AcrR family transcriptional regulator [Gordonia aichiensis]|uniref:Putative TetR family transcriptional regulator n=1 Tax=Gordonia aichiensis NBRC 108223 TaxID=1220583 RepID=L7KLY5_9ACTN|nr:TetR/AcrR family transcriptional regulator C-terminal domain-containing protein [Gordonia aichiensis]GAC49629.1 putative TetR family transcriptional regulator [Gordonia aichiensis NBRC 108223]
MKAIADSLGLSAMSLYRYVDGKDDVVDLLVDEAYGLPEPELTASGPWRDRVGAWARAAATTLRARPWITEIPMSRPPMGPNTVSWTEAGVQAFDDVALTGQQKLNALLLVDGFVRHHVRQSTQMGLLGQSRDGDVSGASNAHESSSGDNGYEATMLELVDNERFPALTAAVSEMSDDDDFFTDQFEFGLTVLLDGLEAMISRTARCEKSAQPTRAASSSANKA